jgi:Protein of unknown function (DUF1638)
MSSSPTVETSTTGSSSSWPSRSADRATIIACGALAQPIADIVSRRGWDADVHPLPPLLHNHPERIAAEVEAAVDAIGAGDRVVVGYADCGSYGALDELCTRRGWHRLPGLHCYDVYGGADRLRTMLERQPGTYLLTDFLVRGFDRLVVAELGLDRHPELRDDYFGHYTRVVWLAQRPTEELRRLAARAAGVLGLPLTEVKVGDHRLEQALESILMPRLHECPTGPASVDSGPAAGGTFVQPRR